MKNPMIGWLPQPGSPLTEASHSLSLLEKSGPRVLLGYTPVARMNPYQALLYQECYKYGIASSEIIPFNAYPSFSELCKMADAAVVHFHWINSVLQGARDEANAKWRVDREKAKLEKLANSGVKIAFTIHNKVAHDAVYMDAELELQQAFLDNATAIHTMSEAGIDSMQEYAQIDASKIILAPHPTYEGVYSNYLSRDECRRALGIRPDEFAFSMFGAIKPYKGLDVLREAWSTFSKSVSRPVRLIVAGAPDESQQARSFVDWAMNEPSVTIQPTKIPFEQVQLFVRCADVGLIPYTRTLNSGSALAHLSFGVPILVSNEKALFENLPSGTYETFTGSQDLLPALERAMKKFEKADLRKDFASLKEARNPRKISAEFSEQLLSKIGMV